MPQTAASRLNLTQAFNSAGTTVGPWVGAIMILSVTSAGAEATQTPYLILAGTLFAIAIAFSRLNLPQISADTPLTDAAGAGLPSRSVWQYRHLVLGAVAIFVYVGAEVTIGSFLVNFMAQDNVASLPESTAGRYLSLYWGGAMVGRFIGSAVLRRVRAGRLLAFNAACVVVLLLVGMSVEGPVAMYAVLAIGLFNSIMFPTIFTLGHRQSWQAHGRRFGRAVHGDRRRRHCSRDRRLCRRHVHASRFHSSFRSCATHTSCTTA